MEILTLKYLLLFVSGIFAGAINMMAAGGSFLTVPILIFLGLPPTVANGTNRLGVFLQNIWGIHKFRKHGVFPLKFSMLVSIPAVIGSILGAYLATIISDDSFKDYFAYFMIAVTLMTVFYQPKPSESMTETETFYKKPWLIPVFFIIGIYGGFIQAGVGFLILTGAVAAGFDMINSNGIKVIVVMIFTIFAIPVFILNGKIDISAGLVLGVGNIIGAHIGATIAVKKGNKFLKYFVTLMVIIFAVKLILT